MESIIADEVAKEIHDTSTSSRESEEENLEAIRRCIEEQEKEIQELEKAKNNEKKLEKLEDTSDIKNTKTMEVIEQGEPVIIATSVIDMILSESEAKIANANIKNLPKQCLNPREKGIFCIFD